MIARYLVLLCCCATITITIRTALWGPLGASEMHEDMIGQAPRLPNPEQATRRGSNRGLQQVEMNGNPFSAALKTLKDFPPRTKTGNRPLRAGKKVRRPKTKEQLELEREVASLNNTYLRQLHPSRLTVCTPRKVASSATYKILAKWKLLPPVNSSQRNPKFDKGSYRFAILRDPLERLYSGYHNKCLFQRETEPDQCPGFPNARQDSPSLEAFLRKARADPKPFYANPHFSPQSRQCPPSRFDQVFRMSSPTFNPEVAQLWLDLGAPLQWIEHDFPLNATQKHQQHSYHANATDKVADEFNCELLILALPLLRRDYQGDYKEHFPFPEWAINILKEPKCIKIREGRLQKIQKAKQQKKG